MHSLLRPLAVHLLFKLYYSLVYSHLTCTLLAWGRSGLANAAKIECAHRRACKSLTDYKHPLCGALSVNYVPVRVTRGALIAHLYTFAPPRCRTSQYLMTFISLSVSLWNDLVDPVFDGVGLAGFKSRSNAFLLA